MARVCDVQRVEGRAHAKELEVAEAEREQSERAAVPDEVEPVPRKCLRSV